jgi:plastocyanin
MTSPSPTRSKSLAAVALVTATLLAAGSVHGRVEIVSSQDPNVRKHSDFSGVVLWLDPLPGPAPMPLNRPRAEMTQRNKRFTPHILPIAVGTTVDFPNFDPIYHNAFSNFDGQIFDVGLYPPGTTRSVLFRREGIVRVFCDIHPTMSAVIVVLRSAYFTTSSKTGEFSIANLPSGSYRLHVFHERATQETLNALTRTIDVADGAADAGVISVSETGFLLLPHKNKYGKDYPPPNPYPGSKP